MRKLLIALILALAISSMKRVEASPVPVGQVVQSTFVIAMTGTTSGAFKTGGVSLVGVQFPAALTSTTMTFTVSSDGVTYVPLYNSGGAVSYTVGTSRYLAVNPADFYGATYFKIVLGTAEGAARSLIAILKGI